jgi:hypothetical protein
MNAPLLPGQSYWEYPGSADAWLTEGELSRAAMRQTALHYRAMLHAAKLYPPGAARCTCAQAAAALLAAAIALRIQSMCCPGPWCLPTRIRITVSLRGPESGRWESVPLD